MATATIESKRNGIDALETSREDLVLNDVVTLTSTGAGANEYYWQFLFKPEGSNAQFSPTVDGVTTEFTVDVEGAYLIRLTVNASDPSDMSSQVVRLRALTAFGKLHLVAAGERKDSEAEIPFDIDLYGWAYNQNKNLRTLLSFIKPIMNSGRVFYVDANVGNKYGMTPVEGFADYSTVQAAIDAAVALNPLISEPYVILVRAGLYVEDLVFHPHVHIVGYNGQHPATPYVKEATPVSEPNDDRIVVIRAATSAGFTTSLPNNPDVTSLTNLHLEGVIPNAANSLLTKSGNGILKLVNCSVVDTVSNPTQKATIQVAEGRLIAQGCKLVMQDAAPDETYVLDQSGQATSVLLENTKVYGPSCMEINNQQQPCDGVIIVMRNCELVSTGSTNAFAIRTNGTCTLDHTTVETNLGKHMEVNWLGSTYTVDNTGNSTQTILWSAFLPNKDNPQVNDIHWNTDHTINTNLLKTGASWYGAVTVTGGGSAVTYEAVVRGESLFYDNQKIPTNLTAENVQDALDEIHGIASSAIQSAVNLGSGEGVFAQKVGSELQFKSLVGGTSGLTVALSSSGQEITLDVNEPFRIIQGDSSITVDDSGSGEITFNIDGTDHWKIDNNGDLIPLPNTNAGTLRNIGSATNRVRSIYVDAVNSVHFHHYDSGAYDWILNVNAADVNNPVLMFNGSPLGGGLLEWSEDGSGNLLPDNDDQQSIGSLIKRVEHLYLGEDSLKLIDGSQTEVLSISAENISTTEGKVYFSSTLDSSGLVDGASVYWYLRQKGSATADAARLKTSIHESTGVKGSTLSFEVLNKDGTGHVNLLTLDLENDTNENRKKIVSEAPIQLLSQDPNAVSFAAMTYDAGTIIYNSASGTGALSFLNNSGNWVSLSGGLQYWAEDASGHFLPNQNAQYDIGSADYKVRHLFLSDNSFKMVANNNTTTSLGISAYLDPASGGTNQVTFSNEKDQALTAADKVDWQLKMDDTNSIDTVVATFRTSFNNVSDKSTSLSLLLNNTSNLAASVMDWHIKDDGGEVSEAVMKSRLTLLNEDPTNLANGVSGGQIIYNNTTNRIAFYDAGNGWTDINPSGGLVDSVNGQTGAVTLNLNNLNDVAVPSPSDQQVLTWIAGLGEWQPTSISTGLVNWTEDHLASPYAIRPNTNNPAVYSLGTSTNLIGTVWVNNVGDGTKPIEKLYIKADSTYAISWMDNTQEVYRQKAKADTPTTTLMELESVPNAGGTPLAASETAEWKYILRDTDGAGNQFPCLNIRIGGDTSTADNTGEAHFSTYAASGAETPIFSLHGGATQNDGRLKVLPKITGAENTSIFTSLHLDYDEITSYDNSAALGSLRSLYMFLDTNANQTDQSFSLYNDVNPYDNAAVNAATPIFKISENGNVDITGDITTATTDNLSEGTNLYYTDGRVDTYVKASINLEDLADVAASPADTQMLQYNATANEWQYVATPTTGLNDWTEDGSGNLFPNNSPGPQDLGIVGNLIQTVNAEQTVLASTSGLVTTFDSTDIPLTIGDVTGKSFAFAPNAGVGEQVGIQARNASAADTLRLNPMGGGITIGGGLSGSGASYVSVDPTNAFFLIKYSASGSSGLSLVPTVTTSLLTQTFQDASGTISLNEGFSVTTNAANAGGSLSYDPATATFTFEPANLSGLGLTDWAVDGATSAFYPTGGSAQDLGKAAPTHDIAVVYAQQLGESSDPSTSALSSYPVQILNVDKGVGLMKGTPKGIFFHDEDTGQSKPIVPLSIHAIYQNAIQQSQALIDQQVTNTGGLHGGPFGEITFQISSHNDDKKTFYIEHSNPSPTDGAVTFGVWTDPTNSGIQSKFEALHIKPMQSSTGGEDWLRVQLGDATHGSGNPVVFQLDHVDDPNTNLMGNNLAGGQMVYDSATDRLAYYDAGNASWQGISSFSHWVENSTTLEPVANQSQDIGSSSKEVADIYVQRVKASSSQALSLTTNMEFPIAIGVSTGQDENIVISVDNSNNLDSNRGIQARNNGVASGLRLNPMGGIVYFGGWNLSGGTTFDAKNWHFDTDNDDLNYFDGSSTGSLTWDTLTTDRVITFPDNTGTVVLLSDLTNYVQNGDNVSNLANDANYITVAGISVGPQASASGGGDLSYDNSTGVFTFTPADLSSLINLTSLSVTTASANAGGALSYDDSTGVFTYTPPDLSPFIALTDLSVNQVSASGGGSLAYDNGTGIFDYTPPDLSSYLEFASEIKNAASGEMSKITTSSTELEFFTDNGSATLTPQWKITDVGHLVPQQSDNNIGSGANPVEHLFVSNNSIYMMENSADTGSADNTNLRIYSKYESNSNLPMTLSLASQMQNTLANGDGIKISQRIYDGNGTDLEIGTITTSLVDAAQMDSEMVMAVLENNNSVPMVTLQTDTGGSGSRVALGRPLGVKNYTTAQVSGIANPSAGDMVYDSTTNTLKAHDGSDWKEIQTGYPTIEMASQFRPLGAVGNNDPTNPASTNLTSYPIENHLKRPFITTRGLASHWGFIDGISYGAANTSATQGRPYPNDGTGLVFTTVVDVAPMTAFKSATTNRTFLRNGRISKDSGEYCFHLWMKIDYEGATAFTDPFQGGSVDEFKFLPNNSDINWAGSGSAMGNNYHYEMVVQITFYSQDANGIRELGTNGTFNNAIRSASSSKQSPFEFNINTVANNLGIPNRDLSTAAGHDTWLRLSIRKEDLRWWKGVTGSSSMTSTTDTALKIPSGNNTGGGDLELDFFDQEYGSTSGLMCEIRVLGLPHTSKVNGANGNVWVTFTQPTILTEHKIVT